MRPLTPRTAEWVSLGWLVVLLVAFAFVPPIAQPQEYHQFSDTRVLSFGSWALPFAADVLSNLAFVAVGLAGLAWASHAAFPQRLPLGLFFTGLVMTGLGSAVYHVAPSDATLVWDRLPMVFAFASAIGALGTERLGPDIGGRWLFAWLYLGVVSVAIWADSGDLRLYAIVQFGGMGVLLVWLMTPVLPGATRLPWAWLLAGYVAAKAFEHFDREIWTLSEGLFSGHPLKHVAAALGVVPMVVALYRRRP